MINEDILRGKWLEIKGEIQKTWGKLTNDELEQNKGDMKAIAGLVLQKYGEEQDIFQKKFSEILGPLQTKKDTLIKEIKKGLKS